MPLIDTRGIEVLEKLPGWRGRIFHSAKVFTARVTSASRASREATAKAAA